MRALKLFVATCVALAVHLTSFAQPRLHELEYVVLFKAGQYHVSENSVCNPQVLDSIRNYIPKSFAKGYFIYTLKHCLVCGVSSPDGDYHLNEALSRKRSESVAAYLGEHAGLGNVQLLDKGNEWGSLYFHVMFDTLVPYRQEVINLLEDSGVLEENSPGISAQRLTQLKELYGGEAYKYLEDNVFPQLRSCGILVVYYSQPKEKNVFPVQKVYLPRNMVTIVEE